MWERSKLSRQFDALIEAELVVRQWAAGYRSVASAISLIMLVLMLPLIVFSWRPRNRMELRG